MKIEENLHTASLAETGHLPADQGVRLHRAIPTMLGLYFSIVLLPHANKPSLIAASTNPLDSKHAAGAEWNEP